MKYSMSGIQGEERSGSKAIFSTINRKVKTGKQIRETIINIFGDQGKSAKIFGIKGTRAKNILGNKWFY